VDIKKEEKTLKKIEAIVRTEKFGTVKDALAEAGYTSLTTYEVKGRGKQSGIVETVSGRIIRVDIIPKTKIEIVADDQDIKKIVEIIIDKASTGNIGDGKLFISPIEDVIRIRTNEKGLNAI
jgi:nitrogen regulatory protein P-II 1